MLCIPTKLESLEFVSVESRLAQYASQAADSRFTMTWRDCGTDACGIPPDKLDMASPLAHLGKTRRVQFTRDLAVWQRAKECQFPPGCGEPAGQWWG